jgi:hypothetical protein
MALNPFFYKPWDERRRELLDTLAQLVYDLDRGEIKHVTSDIRYVYVHFYRGKMELGDLGLGVAFHSLVNDVYSWPDCGRENQRTHERTDLDIRAADRIELQQH